MYQNIYITQWSPESPNMPPICYIWDDEQGLIKKPWRDFNYAYRRADTGEYTSMYGEPLAKIHSPDKQMPGLYESDVPRETRVLTDMYLHSDEPSKNHITMFLDIEVSSEDGFPTPALAAAPITAISVYIKELDVYKVWLLDPDGRVDNETRDNIEIIGCATERGLIEAFILYYREVKPTIISGWNSTFFDIPYIVNRFTKFDPVYVKALSPIGLFKYSEHRMAHVFAGVTHLDYMNVYKKFTYTQKPSYRLDAIAKEEVGVGKIEYEGSLDDLYKNDIDTFIEYSINDVRLLGMMEKKLRLIELVQFICHTGHVPYEDYAYSSRFIEGAMLTYLHRNKIVAANKPVGGAEAFAQKLEDDKEGFTGAYVKPPLPGVYPWVFSLDLQSLYPSIIMSLNISPETKVGKIDTPWDVEAYAKGTLPPIAFTTKAGPQTLSGDAFKQYIDDNEYMVSSNGIIYKSDKLGLIPSILIDWFAKRKEYKDLMKKYVNEKNEELANFYDKRQHVQKILLNSIYGVLGLSIFRFYDLDNALAVTATGQDVIKTTARFINKEYHKRGAPDHSAQRLDRYRNWLALWNEHYDVDGRDHCVYIDTDSTYFSAEPLFTEAELTPEQKQEATIRIAYEFEALVNRFYTPMAKRLFNCVNHRFVIKGESVMESAFWMRKKRYAMLKVYDLETRSPVDHKVAVKGLDVVRSSFPPAFQKFMKDVLKSILTHTPKDQIDASILEFREYMKTLTYWDVAKNTSIKNIDKYVILLPAHPKLNEFGKGTTAHAKAAITYNLMLKELGLDRKYAPIRNGDKIKWVRLKKNPFGIDSLALKTYDDPPELEAIVNEFMDYNRLFDDELSNKLNDFYDALEWGGIPVPKNKNVAALFDYVD
jgi:DNA polymerase elongation subunit (family B)